MVRYGFLYPNGKIERPVPELFADRSRAVVLIAYFSLCCSEAGIKLPSIPGFPLDVQAECIGKGKCQIVKSRIPGFFRYECEQGLLAYKR